MSKREHLIELNEGQLQKNKETMLGLMIDRKELGYKALIGGTIIQVFFLLMVVVFCVSTLTLPILFLRPQYWRMHFFIVTSSFISGASTLVYMEFISEYHNINSQIRELRDGTKKLERLLTLWLLGMLSYWRISDSSRERP